MRRKQVDAKPSSKRRSNGRPLLLGYSCNSLEIKENRKLTEERKLKHDYVVTPNSKIASWNDDVRGNV